MSSSRARLAARAELVGLARARARACPGRVRVRSRCAARACTHARTNDFAELTCSSYAYFAPTAVHVARAVRWRARACPRLHSSCRAEGMGAPRRAPVAPSSTYVNGLLVYATHAPFFAPLEGEQSAGRVAPPELARLAVKGEGLGQVLGGVGSVVHVRGEHDERAVVVGSRRRVMA